MGKSIFSNKLEKSNYVSWITYIVTFIICFYFTYKCTSGNQSNEEILKKAYNEAKNKPGEMVDDETRFDSVSIIDNTGFCFNYTLINLTKNDIDNMSLAENVDPIVKKNALTMKETKIFRDRKIPLTYKYFDKNGILVHTIHISESDY